MCRIQHYVAGIIMLAKVGKFKISGFNIGKNLKKKTVSLKAVRRFIINAKKFKSFVLITIPPKQL